MVGYSWSLHSKFLLALRNGDYSACSNLLNIGMDCDHPFQLGGGDQPAICVAVNGGHDDLVRLLVERGAQVNIVDNRGWTPLHVASARR